MNSLFLPGLLWLAFHLPLAGSELYVSPLGAHQPPYDTWPTAATNIQDAIDAASAGDTVWVTNGIFSNGGKVMAGDLTNRVALDKALTVQSVNGPWVTVIEGAGATNGVEAVRCAWLTDGASLKGFTLRGGATRSSGDSVTLRNGGGVWCTSSSATVANCLIISNASGGAYRGSLYNCWLRANNGASGGSFSNILVNCTVSGHSSGAVNGGRVTNSIVYSNSGPAYYNGTVLAFSCSESLAPGPGNINTNPLLLSDGVHLNNNSPCIGAGINLAFGTDIDGELWANPPAIGCDQWQAAPSILGQPAIKLTTDPVGFSVSVSVLGQEPFSCQWRRNGVVVTNNGHFTSAGTTNLVATGIDLSDPGTYQVIVSNSSGSATSLVAQLTARYVNAASINPTAPFLSWSSAAANIQDAIDAASAGEIIFVTNGVYVTGGKVMSGDLTNRVALNKALIVQSVQGAALTIIQGERDSALNGPLAVRCAWLTNGAALCGFTLKLGATRGLSDPSSPEQNGGGVWAASTNATVADCVITGCSAASTGGGAFQVKLLNCQLEGNIAVGPASGVVGFAGSGGGAARCELKNCLLKSNTAQADAGGGAWQSNLRNCAVIGNRALSGGGGVYGGKLINCTIVSNEAQGQFVPTPGGGAHSAALTNCIVFLNRGSAASNYTSCTFAYSCSFPLPPGLGNLAVDPQLLGDGAHLSSASPCRGAGNFAVTSGTDIDRQPWANPPSMGSDEWSPAPAIAFQPVARPMLTPLALSFSDLIVVGQQPITFSWHKDGVRIEDSAHYSGSQTSNLLVNGFGPGDAGIYQARASNAFGVSTSAVVWVVVHCVRPANLTVPSAPYSSWETAATNIQDAVDVALAGDFVLVTNGVYAVGGRALQEGLTNRVSITKPIFVGSLNGAGATVIRGGWDPATTNGPLAVRCVWMEQGATLHGFTLQDGATRNTGDLSWAASGGAVWASSTNALVSHCTISNNSAAYAGGGCYRAQVRNSIIVKNLAQFGGGASESVLLNCLVSGNSAVFGGGMNFCVARHCTVINNSASSGSSGGGAYGGGIFNSIVYFNSAFTPGWPYPNWAPGGSAPSFSFSCTFPVPPGTGNITNAPQLIQEIYLFGGSPCRNAGNALYASGTDIEGEPWANPPSMGCDEVWEANVGGPLTVTLAAGWPAVTQTKQMLLLGSVTGRPTRFDWSFGDGAVQTNSGYSVLGHAWPQPGAYNVTFTAFNADNPGGVSTNVSVLVTPWVSPEISVLGLTATNFNLRFPLQAGLFHYVERATNLTPPVAWQVVTNFFATGTNLLIVTDAKATNATQFYRVRTF